MKNKLIVTFLILAIFLSCGGKKSYQETNNIDQSPIASFGLSIYLEKNKIKFSDIKFFQDFQIVNFYYFEYEKGLLRFGESEGIDNLIRHCSFMIEKYSPAQKESCSLSKNDQAIFCNKVHSKGLRKLKSDKKYSLCLEFKSNSYNFTNLFPFVIEEQGGELYRYYSAVENNNFNNKEVILGQTIYFGSEKSILGPYISQHLGDQFVERMQWFFKLE